MQNFGTRRGRTFTASFRPSSRLMSTMVRSITRSLNTGDSSSRESQGMRGESWGEQAKEYNGTKARAVTQRGSTTASEEGEQRSRTVTKNKKKECPGRGPWSQFSHELHESHVNEQRDENKLALLFPFRCTDFLSLVPPLLRAAACSSLVFRLIVTEPEQVAPHRARKRCLSGRCFLHRVRFLFVDCLVNCVSMDASACRHSIDALIQTRNLNTRLQFLVDDGHLCL